MRYSEGQMAFGKGKARWGLRVTAIVAIVASCMGSWYIGTAAMRGTINNARLVVSEEQLNIGDVWEDNSFNWILTVKNTTNMDINVKEFLASCSCVSIQPRAVKIPAHQSVDVHLVLDLTSRRIEEAGKKERLFKTSILALTADGAVQHRNEWTLEGRIKSRITITPLILDAGNVRRGEATATQSVSVAAHVPIKELLLEYDREKLKVEKNQLSEGKGFKNYSIELNVSDDLPVGAFRTALKVRVVGIDGEAYPGTVLYIEGVALGDIEAIPAQLVLGCGSLNDSFVKEIVLRSYSGAAVKVDNIMLPSRDLAVESIKSITHGCPAYKVTQKVMEPGDRSSIIKIICHSTHNPKPVILDVRVSYRGLPEKIAKLP